MEDNKRVIQGNKKAMEDKRRVIDEMNKAFRAKMGSDILDVEEEEEKEALSQEFEAFEPVKLKSRRHKKKKQKVKEEASPEPELPDITKTHADTNFNEYGDYSIEKFIPDKKEDE